MGKIKLLLTALANNPMYAIGVILAIVLLCFGLYLGSPWYIGGPATSLGSIFDAQVSRLIIATCYIIPSVGVLLGIKDIKARRVSTFFMFIAYLFATFFRILNGLDPTYWLFVLACALISGIVYLYVSLRDEKRVSSDGLY